MQSINWEEIWKQTYAQKKRMESRDPGISYWDKRAADFSENRKSNDYEYGRKVLAVLEEVLTKDSEVLDIGAGPGTFVIPFAPKVKTVTALEPSKEMIAVMRENAREKGVNNFNIIDKLWQDVAIPEIEGKYDLVVSSLVLWMFEDIWAQLCKMEQASRGYCCLATGIGEKSDDEEKLWREIMGDTERPSYQEYPLVYNLLYAQGRYPNVKTIRYSGERSVESAIRYRTLLFSKYLEMTPAIEEKIKRHILDAAVEGKYRKESASAVIWWNVHEIRSEAK